MDNQNEPLSLTEKAQAHFRRGQELKQSGDVDAALTEFRKAVLVDSHLVEGFIEIGHLCKARGKFDPYFNRHAWEAFRTAARLDLNHQQVHDEYIMATQKMGKLDELLMEYESWVKFNPQNENLARCKKNIINISMALVPQHVNMSGAKASGAMKTMVLLVSLGAIFFSVVLIFSPALLNKFLKISLDKEQMAQLFKIGCVLTVGGVGGLIFFTRIK